MEYLSVQGGTEDTGELREEYRGEVEYSLVQGRKGRRIGRVEIIGRVEGIGRVE